ncbi:HAMP domain-containing sensor histidine kinase [Bacillus sp. J33]|uniref:HAMP domain-containing sensor histidine kinase n=1 Tax=Bacillus sp. J33 TaxID=935836 RepID=UPI00047C4D97|nr:HAMP domain-containing histidine kinase [Bacillus sp. J33]
MKLRKKINLYTSALFAFLLMLMNISVYVFFSKMIIENEQISITEEINKITAIAQESIGSVPEDDLLRAFVPVNGMVRIVSPDQKVISAVTSSDEKELSRMQAEFFNREVTDTFEQSKSQYIFASAPIVLPDGEVGSLQLTRSLETAAGILQTLRIILVSATLLAMIPVLASSAILSKIITNPVASMTNTMREIQESGQFKRLALEGKSKDELYQMGETFNHMIDLLESNFEKQKQFVSNASHELKTPLTVIESYSSLLKRRGLEKPELFLESIDAIHSESVRMRQMTEQLLLLAGHDEQMELNIKSMELNTFLTQVIRTYGEAFKRIIDIESNIEGPAYVQTDENMLKQLLFIFLDNARKYSDNVITVSAGIKENEAYIRIRDRGIGIPMDELPKVFDRFYRVDKARSRKTGGAGLGLSLAKEIAEALGVVIKLESTEGKGTAVTIFIKVT